MPSSHLALVREHRWLSFSVFLSPPPWKLCLPNHVCCLCYSVCIPFLLFCLQCFQHEEVLLFIHAKYLLANHLDSDLL